MQTDFHHWLRVLAGGWLAVSGLACHSSSSTTPTPTTTTTGNTPTVTLTPVSLSFTGPGTLPVVLSNTGTATLTITTLAAGGNFTETDNCAGQSLAVGASCTINVTFALLVASQGGSSGSVTITDNAPDSPESVGLGGPNVSNAAGVLSPPSLTFARQSIGTTSGSQTVMLMNLANGYSAALAVASIATTGDFAVAQNTCPSSIPTGGSCSILVSFTPTAAGMRTGTLNVIDNGVPNLQITQLSGIGQ